MIRKLIFYLYLCVYVLVYSVRCPLEKISPPDLCWWIAYFLQNIRSESFFSFSEMISEIFHTGVLALFSNWHDCSITGIADLHIKIIT